MSRYKIQVVLLDEALTFVRSLPLKVQQKITYNYKKIEFRTLFNGNCYRLFSFWDTETGTLIVATHGIVKKTQKTPQKEIAKAEEIRQQYFELKH